MTEPTVHPWGHETHVHDYGQLLHAACGHATITVHDSGTDHAYDVDMTSAVWIPAGLWHSAHFEPGFVPSVHEIELSGAQQVRRIIVDADVRAELLATRWVPDDDLPLTRAAFCAYELDTAEALPQPHGPIAATMAQAFELDPADHRDLTAWAQSLHTSPATIRRAFKSETGLTYSQWRTLHRVRTAVDLLGQGQRPSRVAARVGYTDAGLAAAVHRHFGCAPSALVGPEPAS